MSEGISDTESGEAAALEYMQKQLYVLTLNRLPGPQIFVQDNLVLAPLHFAENADLTPQGRRAAEAMVRRVMQATSNHLEAIDAGTAIDCR